MLGDSAYDTLAGTTTCWPQGVVPVAPYNARNTDDPKDIEYRVEARIDEHSEDVQLKQSTLDETYNRRSGVERTNDAVKDCGPGTFAPEAASTHEHKCSSRCAFVSLLRSPTTNAETIQEAPSSRYENYSMTPSDVLTKRLCEVLRLVVACSVRCAYRLTRQLNMPPLKTVGARRQTAARRGRRSPARESERVPVRGGAVTYSLP